MDTATKRTSAIAIGSPWRNRLPVPDGTIAQGDRQAHAYYYAGILATGASQLASIALTWKPPAAEAFDWGPSGAVAMTWLPPSAADLTWELHHD